jgi:predicted Zn-dependent peptidase
VETEISLADSVDLSMSAESRIHLLPQGMKLVTVRMPHMASVAFGIWNRVGSRHEQPEEHGMAHLVEHLLFKGTPSRSAEEISRQIEGLGASIDAFTVEDHTAYHAKGPADQFEKLLEVMADFYLNPLFDANDLESEKQVIGEEIAMVRDQPSQLLEDLSSEAAWGPNHPLGRSITGTNESLARLRRNDVLSFFQRSYHAQTTTFSVAGQLEHDAVAELVSRHFAGLPDRPVPSFLAAEPAVDRHRFQGDEELEQCHFTLSFAGLDRQHPDRFALKLLNVILGENMSSRLFQEVRERKGLCYDIQSDIVTFSDGGLVQIYLALGPNHLAEALASIGEVLEGLRTAPVSTRELAEAKSYVIGQSRIALENTSSQMMWAGECLLFFRDWFDPEHAHQAILNVTAAHILEVARRLFSKDTLSTALVGSQRCHDILLDWVHGAGAPLSGPSQEKTPA